MCIAILSTTHPDYRFIILSNRDEFLSRPTAPAEWWTPEASPIPSPSTSPLPSHQAADTKSTRILSARDLARPAHGTWLGINASGRLGVLTNCLEKSCARAVGGLSRGGVIKRWLISHPDENEDAEDEEGEDKNGRASILSFVNHLTGLRDVGGFNLLLGDVRSESLAIISNRSAGTDCCPEDEEGQVKIRWIDHDSNSGETIALSNMTLSDTSQGQEKWKKMSLGEDLTSSAIRASIAETDSEDALIERLFKVLSTDTLPRLPGGLEEDAEAYLGLLRESIFIPALGKPTVMLISHERRVRFVARTLYDDDGRSRLNFERGEGVDEFAFTVG
ncbi:NRDE protein-domain-containing protein [Aspergillus filifer]